MEARSWTESCPTCKRPWNLKVWMRRGMPELVVTAGTPSVKPSAKAPARKKPAAKSKAIAKKAAPKPKAAAKAPVRKGAVKKKTRGR